MPFGLTNAPDAFQHFMNDTLRPFLDAFCIVYLDDIMIYSNSRAEHTRHVTEVLRALMGAQLWVKPEKCEFYQEEVNFLGYVVGRDGVRMDVEKVQVVLDWPRPASIKEIQLFLGFANFYRQFIHRFSAIVAPITRLLQKGSAFDFDAAACAAMDELKAAFVSAPVLAVFNPDLPLLLSTDVTDIALAGVLYQQHPHDRAPRPMAFHSRKLNSAELNYPDHNKEMLAIVGCLKVYCMYCKGHSTPITIHADHDPRQPRTTPVLRRQLSAQPPTGAMVRATCKLRVQDRACRGQEVDAQGCPLEAFGPRRGG